MNARSCLVTGASSGIGSSIAIRLTSEHYTVVGMQRRPPGISVDLSDTRAIPEAWCSALELLGTAPDLVVLNAGRALIGPYHLLGDTDIQSVMSVNLLAPLLLAREALRSWTESGGEGHLVFIGSQAALPGACQTRNALYSALKAARHGLVGPLAAEYGPRVRVNAVAPGDVATPLADNAIRERARIAGCDVEELRAEIGAESPLKRWVLPDEVADAILFLDRCEAMNGVVLNVSGGRTIH